MTDGKWELAKALLKQKIPLGNVAKILKVTKSQIYKRLRIDKIKSHSTDLKNLKYHTPEYIAFKEKAFKKYGRKCKLCGKTKGVLQVDHILSQAYHPELKYDLKNVRILCLQCHKKTPNFARKAKKIGRVI